MEIEMVASEIVDAAIKVHKTLGHGLLVEEGIIIENKCVETYGQ